MPYRQRGLALLALLIVTGALAALLYLRAFQPSLHIDHRTERTEQALRRAKEALLDYAVTYAENHGAHPLVGLLPCPDEGPTTWSGPEREGVANANCGAQAVSRIGRLPFATLGIAPLRDGTQECLWYAVSGTYKNNPIVSGLFNWDVPGLLRVVASTSTGGASPAASAELGNDVVAVVLAPGPAIAQNRYVSRVVDPMKPDAPQCGGNYTSTNYLESDATLGADNQTTSPNPNAISTFFVRGGTTSSVGTNTFNDKVAFITRRELWDAIERSRGFQQRVNALMETIAMCVANYASYPSTPTVVGDRRLPWPVDFVQTPPNRYTDSNNFGYADHAGQMMGRIPYILSNSNMDTARPVGPTDLPSACPSAHWTAERSLWWRHWKDHFFLAIAHDFRPTGVAPNTHCTAANQCLHMNGAGPYAGIVFFAGRSLTGQLRAGAAREDVANYLEGHNLSASPNALGNGDFESHAAPSNTFNDRALCILPDLSLSPC